MSFVLDRFSDSAQAGAAVAEALAGRYIHVAGLGWLHYTGKVWREVPDKVPLAELRRWATAALVAASNPYDPDLVKGWVKRLDNPKLRNALALAEGFDEVSIEAEALDANPDLLNCPNGVVYLPTGDLIPHAHDLYLTKIAGAPYDATALHPDWNAALTAIPTDVQGWLQARYGQAITGHMCPDDRVVIQQGGGENGKSTVLAGVAGALGDYYHQAPARILIGGQNNGATPEMADLRGRRFVAIEETPESGRLDVVGLKNVAGTTRISARKLYRDPVSFPASHTLFVNTNYPPQVGETDEGTWRRLLLVEFPYTFTRARDPQGENERTGDGQLRARLEKGTEQQAAALAWLVEGAARWYSAGRDFGAVPEVVSEATERWRFTTDHVEIFWEDYLDPDPGSYVYAGDLIFAFNQFMRQHGNAPVAESTFVRRFKNHRATLEQAVGRTRLRQDSQTLNQSRPYGSLDPHVRLPDSPGGQVWAWTGVRFRKNQPDLQTHWSEGGESRESR